MSSAFPRTKTQKYTKRDTVSNKKQPSQEIAQTIIIPEPAEPAGIYKMHLLAVLDAEDIGRINAYAFCWGSC